MRKREKDRGPDEEEDGDQTIPCMAQLRSNGQPKQARLTMSWQGDLRPLALVQSLGY